MNSKTKTLILISSLFLGLFVFPYSLSASTVTKTLYSWVKDASGNVSNSQSANVDITLNTPSEKFTKTFTYAIGGMKLNSGDEVILSKYDNVVLQRFNYDDINGASYSAIKSLNPNTKIFLYQMGAEVSNAQDSYGISALNTLGRWNVSRGHSMGNLNTDNPNLFLLDLLGNRINTPGYPSNYVLDQGSDRLRDYWIEATRNDIITQPWKADGIFMDEGTSSLDWNSTGFSANPAKYPTNATWTPAMNGLINKVSGDFETSNQSLIVNYGNSRFSDGYSAWLALNNTSTPPYAALEEGAFATNWTSTAAVLFFSKTQWKSQVDTLNSITNYKPFFQSSAKILPGESGLDNYGKAISFWDIFWYSLASFQLGKNDNSYFGFEYNSNYTNVSWYPDEYDKINLGNAVNNYQIITVGGQEIFTREFTDGYVYVNPNNTDVSNITLPESSRLLTHDNILLNISTIPTVTSINLAAHRGAFLLKASYIPTGGVLGTSTYHFTLNLKQGSIGNEVKELQKILISNNYLSGIPDGIYGSLTKQAVTIYQKANKLDSDGIVGLLTREVLNK